MLHGSTRFADRSAAHCPLTRETAYLIGSSSGSGRNQRRTADLQQPPPLWVRVCGLLFPSTLFLLSWYHFLFLLSSEKYILLVFYARICPCPLDKKAKSRYYIKDWIYLCYGAANTVAFDGTRRDRTAFALPIDRKKGNPAALLFDGVP